MKLRKLFMTLLLALGVGAGVATSVGARVEAAQPKEIVEVEAEGNFPVNEILYLVPNFNWTQDNARFAAYFFNDSTKKNAWVSFTKIQKENEEAYYYCSVPQGDWRNVIFVRMNPGNSTNDWGNKWNQTANLSHLSGKYCYKPTDGWWDSTGDDCWNTNITSVKTTDSVKLSSSTLRIFLNRETHYLQGYTWLLSVNGFNYTPSSHLKISNDLALPQYEIPKNNILDKQIKFIAVDSGSNRFRDETNQIKYNSGDNAQIFTLNKNNFKTIEKKGLGARSITETNAYIVMLESYYTCSSDKDNGYGNAATLFQTWFCYKTSNTENWVNAVTIDHKNIKISDYHYDLEGNNDKSYNESTKKYTGEGSKTKDETNVWDKIQRMLAEQTGASSSNPVKLLNFNNSSTGGATLIIVISSISALCALLVFLKFRKKEEK